ncbi:type VI secretion system-associated protein TagF [Pseudomonas sp. NPDC088368]|jgi:type VI secretion system protein ImpM|uniref:type VI secretion system-associated protein TagF n=1 Tax=Pseudomonas sp. NPDC088368 TaxID=3364453 RepID=UPI0038003740
MTTLGFYGKLASRGDFVSRGLPQSFIKPWDVWLASGLQVSQQQLGEDWLNAYLVSPLWRFALAAGVCGPDAVVGVLMPSIDRVGRYFPLTMAQTLEPDQSLAALTAAPEAWFEQVEALMLGTLEEGADFSVFDDRASTLGFLPTTHREPISRFAGLHFTSANDPDSRHRMLAELACEGASLWWGKGSERIAPGLMRCQGLPDPAEFGSYLLGQGASI